MSAKNVKTLRAAHESWNKRDFAGVIRNSAANLTYADHAPPPTLNTREKFRERTERWAKAFRARLFPLKDEANSAPWAHQARYLDPPRDPSVRAVARTFDTWPLGDSMGDYPLVMGGTRLLDVQPIAARALIPTRAPRQMDV
jgi:hypothetical protein